MLSFFLCHKALKVTFILLVTQNKIQDIVSEIHHNAFAQYDLFIVELKSATTDSGTVLQHSVCSLITVRGLYSVQNQPGVDYYMFLIFSYNTADEPVLLSNNKHALLQSVEAYFDMTKKNN